MECGHPGSQLRHRKLGALLTIRVDWLNPVGWRESRPSHWLGISGQEEMVSRVAEQQSCREKGRVWVVGDGEKTNERMRNDRPMERRIRKVRHDTEKRQHFRDSSPL